MNPKSFDLNIEKILESWQVRHAVREVIANALDEQQLSGTREVVIAKPNGVWTVRDYGRGLRHTHLTQNENQEKLNHPGVIGRFGIGLKDALATFERHGVKVVIRSRFGTIHTAKATKHGFGDIVTLHAVIDEPEHPTFEGTQFEMDGVADEEMVAAKQLFLMFSGDRVIDGNRYGQILERSVGAGSIYINGVKVAQEDNFLFSYNITQMTAALKKAINRERSHVGRSAYTESVKKILLASESADVASRLSDDIAAFQAGTMHDELSWLDVQEHAVKILNAQRPVMMVTAREAMAFPDLMEQAREAGKTILTISESLREKIADGVDVAGNRLVDLTAFSQSYNDSFVFEFVKDEALNESERQVLATTGAIVATFGGLPSQVHGIRISNTLRADVISGGRSVGCWDPQTRCIVILRDQLQSLPKFAGTLLHELVHARSGHADVSRAFETELTELLGKVCSDLHETRSKLQYELKQALVAAQQTKSTEVEEAQIKALRMANALLHTKLEGAYTNIAQLQESLQTQRVHASGLASQLSAACNAQESVQPHGGKGPRRPWYRFWT